MSPSVSVRLLLTQSDARLVEFARAGHERAFEALVQRYRRALLGYCRRLLLSDERAEDALQQALLGAWLALRSGTEVNDVKPWLYRIVHNAALNALRVSGYDYCKLSESLSGANAPHEDLDRRIAVREALVGLAALPEMQREALLRTAVGGGTHQQVARELGLSEPALRGLVYRARTALRAAASAVVPPPLVIWALGSSGRGAPVLERLAELGAGGGSAGMAGLLMKGGAVAVTASVLAGGIAAVHPQAKAVHEHSRGHAAPHPLHATAASLALVAARAESATPTSATPPTSVVQRHHAPARPSPVHHPARHPGRGLSRPSTVPLKTLSQPALSPRRGDGRHGRGDNGNHDGAQSSDSNGQVIAATAGGYGRHSSGQAEQDGSHASGQRAGGDGGSPAPGGGASSTDGGSSLDTGSSGAEGDGSTSMGQPGGSHDHQGSSGTSSPGGTSSSSKGEQAPTSGGTGED
jgi:RNA polymerase sigma factor (sigma-70 family)